MSYGFYFNANKCIGCRTCEIACKEKWDLEAGIAFRSVRSFEFGAFPEASLCHYSGSCNHCENPACVAKCPQGALYVSDEGTIQHDGSKCIGCGSCVEACPYHAPKLLGNPKRAGKCNACTERREQGQLPSCVESCHMRCLDFGEISELEGKYGTDLPLSASFLPSVEETAPRAMLEPSMRAGSAKLVEKCL